MVYRLSGLSLLRSGPCGPWAALVAGVAALQTAKLLVVSADFVGEGLQGRA